MAWWGHGVLSGDRPLGLLSWLSSSLGLGDTDGLRPITNIQPQAAQHVRSVLSPLTHELGEFHIARATAVHGHDPDSTNLAWQVLALLAMAAHVDIDDDARERMLAAGRDDTWATRDPERRAVMDRYIEALTTYDTTHTPWELLLNDPSFNVR